MYTSVRFIVTLLSVSLFVCGSQAIAADEETVLATVNGVDITAGQIEQLPGIASKADFDALEQDRKAQVIIGLINRQLVLEQAKKEGFDQTAPMVKAINDMADSYIAKQYMINIAARTDIREEVLVAYYEEVFLTEPEQYEVAHILLATEKEANTVLELLNKGADFSNQAKTKSKDRVSAENGGSLGRLTSGDMLPSFYLAVSKLNPGETGAQPTKTQFGWHIVRLDAKHKPGRQPFDEVRQQIQQELIKKQIATYLDMLRSQATVEIRY